MSVNVIGNGPAVAYAPSRPGAGGATPPGGDPVEARADAGPEPAGRIVRQAWFDLNGDGKIDDRSSLYGGDGVVIVPESVAEKHHTRPREVSSTGGAITREDHPNSPVVVEQAKDAYARYGREPDTTNEQPTEHAGA